MKIKKLNSLYCLIEGLDKIDFDRMNSDIQAAGEVDNSPKNKLQKIIKTNKSSRAETLKEIENQVTAWDHKNLTIDFSSVLYARFAEKGIRNNDVVVQWLTTAADNNISSLDAASATTLFNLLDSGKISPNSPYIINGKNNLFTESSKDISYKLNVLAIVLNPEEASKYSNSKNESPSLDLIYVKQKFLDANTMKKNLNDFVEDSGSFGSNSSFISISTWIITKGKGTKGKEIESLIKNLNSFLESIKDPIKEDIPSRILLAIQERDPVSNGKNKFYDKNLKKAILDYKIDPNKCNSWGDLINTIVTLYKDDELSSKEINTTISTALLNYLPSSWRSKTLNNEANLIKLLKGYILKDLKSPEKERYFEMLKIFSSNDLRAMYLGTGIKDNSLKTIIDTTKNFLNKHQA